MPLSLEGTLGTTKAAAPSPTFVGGAKAATTAINMVAASAALDITAAPSAKLPR